MVSVFTFKNVKMTLSCSSDSREWRLQSFVEGTFESDHLEEGEEYGMLLEKYFRNVSRI
jgi:hypothetical protein